MKVYIQPPLSEIPLRGGVKTHILKLYKHLELCPSVDLVNDPEECDILHVQSAWPIPKTKERKKVIFTCHGGFLPSPIAVVLNNLRQADTIVSVSQWIADEFFPSLSQKTVVIPNGIDIEDHISQKSKNYVLYAKEWAYEFDAVTFLARNDIDIVTTIWEDKHNKPDNVFYIYLQSHTQMMEFVSMAGCLLLTGSEVCPTMLLEAWASKVPVVANNLDGSREIAIENENKGILLYNTQEELLDCVNYVLNHRDELGEEGYKQVVRNYQWKDLVERYLEVYKL